MSNHGAEAPAFRAREPYPASPVSEHLEAMRQVVRYLTRGRPDLELQADAYEHHAKAVAATAAAPGPEPTLPRDDPRERVQHLVAYGSPDDPRERVQHLFGHLVASNGTDAHAGDSGVYALDGLRDLGLSESEIEILDWVAELVQADYAYTGEATRALRRIEGGDL